MDDPEPNFKHYCRVCKKGFMCGRALGGHMRAHGIGDETGGGAYVDDDDPGSDWEEKGTDKSHSKRIYQLRTNPNRLKSCRNCENCGKEFLSWKSFLEHGKCSSDDASESLVSSPDSYGDEEDGGGLGRRGGGGGGGGSKRKRSLRSKVGSGEEDDLLLARCLVQLANTVVDPPSAAEPEESCASASREEDHRRNAASGYYYSSVPQQQGQMIRDRAAAYDYKAKGVSSPGKGVFECKACKKVFNSHQALGGHRASHKKVKGCFAAKQDITEDQHHNHNHNSSSPAAIIAEDEVIINDEFLPAKPSPAPALSSYGYENTPVLVGSARRKSKVHECSICHRIFPSGQALGGHKRCHWITSNSPETSSMPKFNFTENTTAAANANANSTVPDKLDLNVPAWAHVSGVRRDPNNPLSFEVSTDMHLQIPSCHPLNGQENNSNNKNGDVDEKGVDVEKNGPNPNGVDDEAASELKLSRLSDLNDLKYSSNSSQWLQVGIGSTTQAAAADL